MTLAKRIDAIAVEHVQASLRELAEAERTIADNHESRRDYEHAAIHGRQAQLFAAAADDVQPGRD